MEDRRILKIFGERNTGTRALAAILRQVPGVALRLGPAAPAPQYDAAVQAAIETELKGPWKRLYLHAMRDDIAARYCHDDPWKHAVPRLTPAMIAARVSPLMMVRDPYSWLIGLARRPYHMKGPNAVTLEGFAARPWMAERREGVPAVLASPMDLWSRKARGTLACRGVALQAGLGGAVIRFEDFVQDPAGAAAGALAAIGVDAGSLDAPQKNTKPREAPLSALQEYYGEARWKARLSRETVRRVNAQTDWTAAAGLGYAPLDPADFPAALPAEISAMIREEMASLGSPADRKLEAGT